MTGYCKYYIGPFGPSDPNPDPKPIPNLNLTNGGCYVTQLQAGSFQTVTNTGRCVALLFFMLLN